MRRNCRKGRKNSDSMKKSSVSMRPKKETETKNLR